MATSGLMPNPIEWMCLAAQDDEAFTGLIESEDIHLPSTFLYRCPSSDHLWIFWQGMGESPTLYALMESSS